jgi:hypothetical protein
MAWFGLGRSDHELAATKYAGRESATDRARRRAAERGSMGKPHHNARDADRTGWTWWDRRR